MTSDSTPPDDAPPRLHKVIGKLKKKLTRKRTDVLAKCDYENLDVIRKEMIRGIIKLPDLNARDIMIPRVDMFCIDSQTGLKPIVTAICKAGHSRVPVYEGTIDNIIGMLYVKDLLRLLIEPSKKKFNLKKILHEPYFVPETMRLDELLLEFKKRKLHIAVVVDEYGGISGVVTLEDILEEIVGDINDEFDLIEQPVFEKLGRNTYDVDSRMPIAELNEKLELALPEDDFDTIGGYVFDLFGKIPEKGEAIRDREAQFTIKDIRGTIIHRIIISVLKKK